MPMIPAAGYRPDVSDDGASSSGNILDCVP
jgi:hypothetical protein